TVESGEVVGVDGRVVAGEAMVVPWIGSTTQVTKKEGDAVVAGARVVSGSLRVTGTWAAHERAWSRLLLSPALRVDVAAPIVRLARTSLGRGRMAAAVFGFAIACVSGAPIWEAIACGCAAALGCLSGAVECVVGLCHVRAQLKALEHGIVYKDAR